MEVVCLCVFGRLLTLLSVLYYLVDYCSYLWNGVEYQLIFCIFDTFASVL